MAFADLGSVGSTGNTGNNQVQLILTTTAAVAVGDLVVVAVAVDNPQNGGDAGVSSILDSVGDNTWIKAAQVCNAVAAQGGASCSIWYTVATNAIPSGGTIRPQFSNAPTSDAAAMTVRKFSKAAGMNVALEGTPTTLLHNTALDPGALDLTTANIACLRIRACAIELGSATNWTPTASWTAFAGGQSATSGTTIEMAARAEFRIFTGTSASSNPTQSAQINANVYVAFKEVLPEVIGTLNINEDIDTISATSNVLVDGGLIELQDNFILDAEADVVVRGTLSIIENGDLIDATGEVEEAGPPPILGILNQTQDPQTLSSVGTIVVRGTLSVTQSNQSLTAIGTISVTGILSATQANQTLSASGGPIVRGTLAVTQSNQSLTAIGTIGVRGTLTTTQANQTLTGSGVVVVRGILNTAQASQTLSGTAVVISGINGVLNLIQAAQILSATGKISVTGSLVLTQENHVLAAVGKIRITATLSLTQQNQILSGSGSVVFPPINGFLDITQGNQILIAAGSIAVVGSFVASQQNQILVGSGLVSYAATATLVITQADQILSASGRVYSIVITWDSESIPYPIIHLDASDIIYIDDVPPIESFPWDSSSVPTTQSEVVVGSSSKPAFWSSGPIP